MKFYLHYYLFFFLSIIWINCAQIVKECVHDSTLVEHSADENDIDILAASKLRPFLQEVITERRNECFHSKFGPPSKLAHYYDAQYRHAMSALSAYEKAMKECRNDEMLVNQSASSNNQRGLRTIVNSAFEERKLCAQRNGPPAMMEELLRYYKLQENRVMHAITVMENAEDECQLDANNFHASSDLRNFFTQAFNARVMDCAATTKWMNKNEQRQQKVEMDTMLENYRREWKERFPAILEALDKNQKTESTTKPPETESTTKPTEGTTKAPENDKAQFWMIIAIALFCSNCAFAVCIIVICLRKPKSRSVHSPPQMLPREQIIKDERVRPHQAWEIPVHKSPTPLVTPLYSSQGVNASYDDARP